MSKVLVHKKIRKNVKIFVFHPPVHETDPSDEKKYGTHAFYVDKNLIRHEDENSIIARYPIYRSCTTGAYRND